MFNFMYNSKKKEKKRIKGYFLGKGDFERK